MPVQHRDTEWINRYLTENLKNTDLINFKVRMLRDAAFLEKVFLQKLTHEASDNELLLKLLEKNGDKPANG